MSHRRWWPTTFLPGVLLVVAGLAPSVTAAPPELARTLLRSVQEGASLTPAERFALAWQLSDGEAMDAALAADDFPAHLREWAAARRAEQRGASTEALLHYRRAARAWPQGGDREPLEVRRVFDRARVETAVEAGDLALAVDFLDSLLSEEDDPVLGAHRAWIALREIDPDSCARRLDRQWARASELDREHAVFLRRPLAHLAAGDTLTAGQSWVEGIETLSRPQARRQALEVWDQEPMLAEAVLRIEDAGAVRRWLARSVRRPEAIELARRALATAEGPGRGELFAEIAEHHYRLRDGEALRDWLARPWPTEMDDEIHAELQALPLRQERRGGFSRELAEGFEQIARRFPETDRALEALWEASWMYELEGDLADAIRLHEEFVERAPRRRRADDAALRSLVLRYRRGDDYDELRRAYAGVERALGDDIPAACALWILGEAARSRGGEGAVDSLQTELRERFPDSPLTVQPLPGGLVDEASRDAVARRLYEIQRRAFDRVGEYLESGEDAMDRRVQEAERLLELGLVRAAETRLLHLARTETSDTALLFQICRAAWRGGSPEVQARVGFLLRRRLQDDGEELQPALLAITRPTPFFDAVWRAAGDFELDPEILWAVMRRESFYDADVVSVAGAHGLVQLMPPTARTIAETEGWSYDGEASLFQPLVNLRFGAQHLRDHLRTGRGDPFFALAAYNAGPAMAETWRGRLVEGEPPALLALIISYHETRAYVYDVLRNQRLYRRTYPVLDPGPSR